MIKTKLLLIALLSAFTLPVWAAKQSSTQVYDNPAKPILVTQRSSTVSIKLTSNGTTGYSWFLGQYNPALVKPISAQYRAPKSMIAGAPGYMVWTFKLKAAAFTVPQMTSVQLIYARPWDIKDNAGKTIVFVTR